MSVRHHGILMRAPMVRALLRHRNRHTGSVPKTQTRRIITAHNSTVLGYGVTAKSPLWTALDWKNKTYPVRVDRGPHILHCEASEYLHVTARWDGELVQYRVRCRVSIGDLFYVKETAWFYKGSESAHFAADEPPNKHSRHFSHVLGGLFMPKRYARIWLKVTSIRAQRLQEITEEDAWAEGLEQCPANFRGVHVSEADPRKGAKGLAFAVNHAGTARFVYQALWESINNPRGRACDEDAPARWHANPWVWIYDFKRVPSPLIRKSKIETRK